MSRRPDEHLQALPSRAQLIPFHSSLPGSCTPSAEPPHILDVRSTSNRLVAARSREHPTPAAVEQGAVRPRPFNLFRAVQHPQVPHGARLDERVHTVVVVRIVLACERERSDTTKWIMEGGRHYCC